MHRVLVVDDDKVLQDSVKEALLYHSFSVDVANNGKEALQSFAEGDELRMMLMGLKRYTKLDPFNTKNARRAIATKISEDQGYKF